MEELQVDAHRKEEERRWSLLSQENLQHNDQDVVFYAVFPDYETLIAFFEELLDCDAEVVQQWRGADSKDNYEEVKCGQKCKLPFLEHFFLTLVRIHISLLELDIAHRFGVAVHSMLTNTNIGKPHVPSPEGCGELSAVACGEGVHAC